MAYFLIKSAETETSPHSLTAVVFQLYMLGSSDHICCRSFRIPLWEWLITTLGIFRLSSWNLGAKCIQSEVHEINDLAKFSKAEEVISLAVSNYYL
jgi:hypothetical protein